MIHFHIEVSICLNCNSLFLKHVDLILKALMHGSTRPTSFCTILYTDLFLCRSCFAGRMLRSNSFLLSIASPVLHKMLCGGFREGVARQISFQDVDGKVFEEVLHFWCGKEAGAEKELSSVMAMASVADRLEMLEVVTVLEAAITGEIHAGMCAEALMSSRRLGLRQVEEAAWGMLVERFDEVSRTAGFIGLDEETVGSLLEEDGLGVRKEEEVFEGLVRWMKGDAGGGLRGRELLRKIRFGVMEEGYLDAKARKVVPEEYGDWMEGLVREALRAKAAVRARAAVELGQLASKALTRRRGQGVDWGRCSQIGVECRLGGHSNSVFALAECEGRMCSGSADGSIRIWNMTTLEEERVLRSEAEDDGTVRQGVQALASWGGHLISGHYSGRVRVWDVASGERRQELDGRWCISSLCVVGSRLACGSWDCSIRVWRMGPGPDWPCELTLIGHADAVCTLAGWEGKLISGSTDKVIRIWDLETGGLDAVLPGHRDNVLSLLVHGKRLFSASADGTIRAWAVGTWAAVASVEARDVGSGQWPRCLAARGAKLISGSDGLRSGGGKDADEDRTPFEVRVWDVETMTCEHTLRQPPGTRVWCLAATSGGDVWGGVGAEVVVWGRD